MKRLLTLLAMFASLSLFGQRQDIEDLRPAPDSLDEVIVPKAKWFKYGWDKKPVADWWAGLSSSSKAAILSGAIVSAYFESDTLWVVQGDDTTAIDFTSLGGDTLWWNAVTRSAYIGPDSNLISEDQGGYRFNVAIGANNLVQATTTTDNIAIGREVLRKVTSGTGNNIGIGQSALDSLTSGSYNIAFGYRALRLATTGSRNFAAGQAALDALTTGNDNIGIGLNAGGSITTGANNIVMGNAALSATTGSSGNVVFGSSALQFSTAASNNVVIGLSAMTGATTTSNSNVAVGANAGYREGSGSDSNTSCNGSVFIGYDTRASASGNQNEIVIGANTIGKGTNTASIGDNNVTVLWMSESVGWFRGEGDPENVVTAPVGSFYSRTDGSTSTTFYVKETGSGNTGWVAK